MEPQAEAPQESFREAKTRELRERREGREAEDKAIDAELKEQFAQQPAEDVVSEDVVEDGQLSDNASEEEIEEESELEQPADDSEVEDDTDDLETRFNRVERERAELEKKLSQVTANRQAIEDDFAGAQKRFVEMGHQMEDSLTELNRGAEFFASLAGQELQQLQQVNPAQLTPEQQAQYYQNLNAATQRAQQLQGMYQQASERQKAEMEMQKKRHAEVAVAELKAKIPEWSNEHYSALGEIAGEYGYSPDEFREVVDPRLIRLLHNDWKTRQASKAIEETVTQRKAKAPRGRTGASASRNAKGQFEKAKKDFRPNERGTFAKMKEAEIKLRRERRN